MAGAFTPEFLITHRDDIIVEWERRAVMEEGAAKLTPLALRDEMPAFVDELAAWLSGVEETGARGMRAVSAHHALQRLDSSLDLAQLIGEFRILRSVILEMLLAAEAAEQERRPSGSQSPTSAGGRQEERVLDLARLNSGLDFAIGDVVEAFVAERDRRLAEFEAVSEAARAAQARYGELVQLSPDAIMISRNDKVDFVNPAAVQLLGASQAQELLGRSIYEVFHPDFHAVVEQRVARLREGEPQVPRMEERILRLDGRVRVVEVAGSRFEDKHGPAIQLVLHDVTDRRRAEEALRASDQQKSVFLGVLAHELRNPLAPIRNSLFILDHVPPESPQAQHCKAVLRRQTEQLARLVDDLLDLTRIERGKIELRPAVVDLREIVRGACDANRALFERSGQELRCEESAGPVWVNADTARLSQVLDNLLNNATKFTPEGGTVTVGVRASGSECELSVRDTGVGMDPTQIDGMFSPFAQAESTLARTRGGLGLGLSLARGIVQLHGGSLTGRSEGAQRGSEFTVTLPVVAAPAGPAHKSPLRPQIAAMRVVVIEDNVDAGESLAAVLRLAGHEVHLAREGRAGITLAREVRPHVVICDIGLPDIAGYEVAETLRADERLSSTTLVALSGYVLPEDRARASSAGFHVHLAKPVAPETVYAAIAELGSTPE
jgi:PAS domain S-box-containing protein